ncbi:interferon regulatory factor 3-like isoform X1 [Eleutherodactylus coqui]|uniref:interferon regulatory factor 3-like isoform X1 n=2 Tax=Eleutherodactylus coqui TaxID=57060 RepID=UPI0034622BC2
MSSQKPRIIPWLISQIDSKIYPGLEWVNSEHTQFRVPWKHALRQDRSPDDFKIFEAWANASGCYDPLTDLSDPARWKRNFRSALNQKDGILMILDRSSDSVNPHKIFELTIPAHGATEQYNNSPANPNFHPISSTNQGIDSAPQRMLFEELEQLKLSQEEEGLYHPCNDLQGSEGELDPNLDGAAAAAIPLYGGDYVVYSDFPSHIATEVEVEHVLTQPVQDFETFQQSILKHFSYNSFETNFEVKIYYRGKLVQTTTVTNPHGFYITAEPQPGHSSYLDRVYLPPPALVLSDKVLVAAVNDLLSKLKEGTLVEVRQGAICAKRFGYCRSYWSMTNTPTTKIPNPIDKTEFSVLKTIQQFITELIDFVEKRRKESPQYNIWICLGEQWPYQQRWDKNCIMLQVIPVTMQLLHELSYSTGASSLNSHINLEISDSLTSTSNLLSLLRTIEDVMDWE